MKIGLSLSPEILLEKPKNAGEKILLDTFKGVAGLLWEIKSRGITYIELRSIIPEDDQYQVMQIINRIWSAGLKVSIHGKLTKGGIHTSFEDFYPPLHKALKLFPNYQKDLNIVVHAFTSPESSIEELTQMSVDTLNRWISMLENDPVKLAVEINRKKEGRNDPCTNWDGVLEIVNNIDYPNIGICWDMGHVYYNILNGFMIDEVDGDFINKVIHTHIHGLGEKGTHCTITPDESLPLEKYLGTLKKSGYKGIYNLEFSFEKFPVDTLITEFIDSIEKLSNT